MSLGITECSGSVPAVQGLTGLVDANDAACSFRGRSGSLCI